MSKEPKNFSDSILAGRPFKLERKASCIKNKTMIKIDLEHNLTSLKIPELRVDPQCTILALKENIEKRYGSEPPYVRLTLKSKEGNVLTQMEEDMRTLDFYGVEDKMFVSISDLNPASILKEIENSNQVEKYTMS